MLNFFSFLRRTVLCENMGCLKMQVISWRVPDWFKILRLILSKIWKIIYKEKWIQLEHDLGFLTPLIGRGLAWLILHQVPMKILIVMHKKCLPILVAGSNTHLGEGIHTRNTGRVVIHDVADLRANFTSKLACNILMR